MEPQEIQSSRHRNESYLLEVPEIIITLIAITLDICLLDLESLLVMILIGYIIGLEEITFIKLCESFLRHYFILFSNSSINKTAWGAWVA